MTKKLMKIVSVMTIILFFSLSYVFATDINLNLPGLDVDTEENLEADENNIDNETVVDENVINATSIDDVDDSNYNSYSNYETLQVTSTSSNSQTGLTTSDIINILLITVGVILILLAIAIMIRLR